MSESEKQDYDEFKKGIMNGVVPDTIAYTIFDNTRKQREHKIPLLDMPMGMVLPIIMHLISNIKSILGNAFKNANEESGGFTKDPGKWFQAFGSSLMEGGKSAVAEAFRDETLASADKIKKDLDALGVPGSDMIRGRVIATAKEKMAEKGLNVNFDSATVAAAPQPLAQPTAATSQNTNSAPANALAGIPSVLANLSASITGAQPVPAGTQPQQNLPPAPTSAQAINL